LDSTFNFWKNSLEVVHATNSFLRERLDKVLAENAILQCSYEEHSKQRLHDFDWPELKLKRKAETPRDEEANIVPTGEQDCVEEGQDEGEVQPDRTRIVHVIDEEKCLANLNPRPCKKRRTRKVMH
jgi:hypothetical protein